MSKAPRKTTLTHVIDASGYWYVHDGGPQKNVVVTKEGKRLEMLSRDEASKGKDYAATILKLRMAGIKRHEEQLSGDAKPVSAAVQNPDKQVLAHGLQLEQMRAPAVNAAAGAAKAAQMRHDAQKKTQELQDKAKAVLSSVPALDALDDDDLGDELDDGSDLDDGALDGGLEVDADLGLGLGLSADDAAHAKEQADKDLAESELLGEVLFATEKNLSSDDEIKKAWKALDDKARATYRWRAMNESAPAPAAGAK